MDWTTVTAQAKRFEHTIAQKWPKYLEEMKGACGVDLRTPCNPADENLKASLMDQARTCSIS